MFAKIATQWLMMREIGLIAEQQTANQRTTTTTRARYSNESHGYAHEADIQSVIMARAFLGGFKVGVAIVAAWRPGVDYGRGRRPHASQARVHDDRRDAVAPVNLRRASV